MKREWQFFDQSIIRSELDSLPSRDAAKLTALMEIYKNAGFNNPLPAVIDDYGDGIKRLRHLKSAYQGRMLYFATDRSEGFERLIVLTVYKKESQDVPQQILERARSRKALYEKGKHK